jgi:Putative Zn-dependent protease, contains TPR repeats
MKSKRVNRARLLLALLFVLAFSSVARCQCADAQTQSALSTEDDIQQRFAEKSWPQVIQLAASLSSRSADANFAYGMALAHMQRWTEARETLLAGYHQCPQQERFSIELAGVAFEMKRYNDSARWLQKALKLKPHDAYANDFAGTVYLLMGNVNAALKYWNRVGKPYVVSIQFDPLRVQRLVLDRSFAFSPAALLHKQDYETTETRLDSLGIFPTHNITLKARSDARFDVEFHAIERNGFGSGWLQALASTFSGVAYETIYPDYFNIGGSATNVESLLRWDSQKRRAWLSIGVPLHNRPQWRTTFQFDVRDENWAIRNSFTGSAPVLASFKMERQSVAGFLAGIPSSRLQWSAGSEVSNRRFHSVLPGTTLAPELVESGFVLKALGSAQGKLYDLPERRFTITSSAAAELARIWPSPRPSPHLFAKVQVSAAARWFPQAVSDTYEIEQRVRAGHIFHTAPVDELYLLGMERDTDLWLRGHVGTRDGQKGSSPLVGSYFLSNSDFLRRIYSNGLIRVKAGPLLDIARAIAPSGEFAGTQLDNTNQWLFDTGLQLKLSLLGASIALTWGHDLCTGKNAFYGMAAQH